MDSLPFEPLVCFTDPQIKIQCVYHIVFQLIHNSTNKKFIPTLSKQALYYTLEIHPLTIDNLCGCYTSVEKKNSSNNYSKKDHKEKRASNKKKRLYGTPILTIGSKKSSSEKATLRPKV